MTIMSALIMEIAQRYYYPQENSISKNSHGLYIKKWKFYAGLGSVLPILIAGFRVNVGTDYLNYLKPNMYIGSVFNKKPISMEPIYRLVVEIGYRLNSVQFVYFFTALIFTYFMYKFICENSKNWAFSVVLFLFSGTFSQSLNIMRQMVATAICLYAIKYAKRNELKKYLLCVICAMGFHYIAAIYLLLYPIINNKQVNKKIGRKKSITIILICGIAYINSKFFSRVLYKAMAGLGISYANYFGSIRDSGASGALTMVQFSILAILLIINERIDKIDSSWTYISMFACGVLAIGLPSANRLSYLFIPSQIVALPNYISSLKNVHLRRLVGFLCMILLGCFWYYYFFKLNVSETFPYKSVWTK